MRLVDEIAHLLAEPVVAAGITIGLVHSLLDNGPIALAGEEKNVMIKLVAVLHRGAVHFG